MDTEPMTAARARELQAEQEHLDQLGPTARRCATLRVHLTNLHRELSLAEERLEPVLMPKQPVGPEERTLVDTRSPLGAELDDLADQLLSAVRRVSTLMDRVEL